MIITQSAALADYDHAEPHEAFRKEMAKQLVCYPMEQITLKTHRPTITERDLCLAVIYQKRNGSPLWVTFEGPGDKAKIIKTYLKHSFTHGLNPSDYQVDRIETLWDSRQIADLAELDALLTYNLVKYIHDISYGQLKPLESDPELFAEAGETSFNPVTSIEISLNTQDLGAFLAHLPPSHQHYAKLKTALNQYYQFAHNGGWPFVPEGKTLYPGDIDPRVTILRQRLRYSKDYTAYLPSTGSDFFSQQLERAVVRFQKRHGLEPDGIVGKNTFAALNISAEERFNTIRLNMARWRWQDHDLGEKYVLVNIASYTLKAYMDYGEKLVLDIPVIVGKRQNQTPVFSDSIKYIDINPFWNITPSIARNEELPELRKNPLHLVERNVRLFSSWDADAIELDSTTIDWNTVSRSQMSGFKLRQDPGPWNALGKIKFVFPNQYSVYMHDTPTPDLFNNTQRNFSHGCIRVSDPLALAIFTLGGQQKNWDKEMVQDLYNQSTRKVIRLSTPLPVHITYQTTWVDKDGSINFNRDIYARDKKLHNALLR